MLHNLHKGKSNMMRCLPISIAVVLCLPLPAAGAVRGDEVMYVGGTWTGIAENTEGKVDISGQSAMVFTARKFTTVIPYQGIASLEYGEKAGRRVAASLAASPVALLFKKRKHYITITYNDEAGSNQSVVFELAKGVVNSVVNRLETRSGKKLAFESEAARKQFEKETK